MKKSLYTFASFAVRIAGTASLALLASSGLGCMAEAAPENESDLGTTQEAIGESTCATVDDTLGMFHAAWSGPSNQGKGVSYVANSSVGATSPDNTYGNSSCTSAWITDVANITDNSTHTRNAWANPVTMPTNSTACSLIVQEASVYYHVKGQSWGTWTQLGGSGHVYQWGASWTAFGCLMNSSGIPSLPNTGIDEVRVASLSLAWPSPLLQTSAGIIEF